jgi:dihydrofolate synthase/folylpolyglutamate synthase
MRFTRLQDWLDWQLSLHTKPIDLGLERVSSVWKKLPQLNPETFVISIAGTNGKGSAVAYLEAILDHAGYSVGCYTSPHLVRYNERIRINGREVSDQQLCEAFQAIDEARGDTSLSYFEFGTLAALYIFSQTTPDVVVLEVGLGGRLDAVNIIDADAALITSIGLDHQDWLGNDRETIGREKAGILRKEQCSVFSGQDMPESIRQYASQIGSKLIVAGTDYHVINHQNEQNHGEWQIQSDFGNRHALPLPVLRGSHQVENAAGVIALLLSCRDKLPVASDAMRAGLVSAKLKGRFQVLPIDITGDVNVVIDVAHNPDSMLELARNLAGFVIKGKLHVIVGMLKDKQIDASLEPLLKEADCWYLLSTPGDRGLSASELAKVFPGDSAKIVGMSDNIEQVFQSAMQQANAGDTLLITGSFLVAGACLEMLEKQSGPEV